MNIIDNIFSVSDVLKTFSHKSSSWDKKNKYFHHRNGERKRLFSIIPSIISENDKVLDIGAGTGKASSFLKKSINNVEVYSMDLSHNMLSVLSEKVSDVDGLFMMDIHESAFASESFDAVVGHQVIHHLNNPLKALKEIYRLLKPGGYALFSTVGSEYQANVIPYTVGSPSVADPLGRFSQREICDIATGAGFSKRLVAHDFFEMRFRTLSDYIHFMDSIGSLYKVFGYLDATIEEASKYFIWKYKTACKNINASFDIPGHYVTVLLQKPIED